MKNRKLKKGFTLVELIVVIAIVAILAAVSVVSYIAFIRQANESADIQLVKQLNTSLQGDETLNGPRSTMHEMLGAMEDNGFVVENLTKTKSGYDIVWDKKNNRFGLLDKDKVVYGEDSFQITDKNQYNFWKFADTVEEAEEKHYSIYLTNDFAKTNATSLTVYAGLDVGDYAGLSQVNYTNIGDPQTVTIRTKGGKLEVNAEKDTVNHYDFAKSVDIKAVDDKSYHEYGQVGFTQIAKGHYVAEEGASVNVLLATGSGNDVKIDNNGAEIQEAYTTDVSAKETQHGGNEFLQYYNISSEAGNNDKEKLASAIEKLEASGTMFAGGTGTRENPWIIYDQESFKNVGNYYDANDTSKFYYWKVREGITEIDMTGWKSINLQGYIEGNNVTLHNLTAPLFENGNYCDDTLTVANMNIEANIVMPGKWTGVLFRDDQGSNLLIDNVDISGYIEGAYVWSYVGQCEKKDKYNYNIEIKDSTSSVTMFGSGACGGMIGYLGQGKAVIDLKVTNSKYIGTMIRSANTYFTYFGFNSNDAATISITLDEASANADFTFGNNTQPEAKTYRGKWTSIAASTVYTNNSKKVVGSLSVNVDDNRKIKVAKGNSTRAVANLMIGPNPGNMYTGYYTEELIQDGDNWVSNKLIVFTITCDNSKPIGISQDGSTFNVHGEDENIHIANILVTEYDSLGNVINVGIYTIPESNYPDGKAYK